MATEAKVRLITPPVRLAYVNLAKPDKNGKYKVTGIFNPKTAAPEDLADMKKLVQAVEEQEKFIELKRGKGMSDYSVKKWIDGQRTPFTLPFRKGGEPGVDWLDKPEFEGCILLPMGSKEIAVGTVNERGVTCDPKELYSGCYAICTVTIYAYNNESKGINFGLQSVMKIRDGAPLGAGGGNAERDFAGIDLNRYGVNDNSAEFI